MIQWLLFGALCFCIGWVLRGLWDQTGGRHLIDIDPGLSPVDRHGNRMVSGELAAPAEFLAGARYLEEEVEDA